jgi:hypothetical protein
MGTAISAVMPRRRTTVTRRVLSVTSLGRPWARVDVVVGDGSGTLTLRFLGRREVLGMRVGRSVRVEGTPAKVGEVLIMLNPLYEFLADLGDQAAPACRRAGITPLVHRMGAR